MRTRRRSRGASPRRLTPPAQHAPVIRQALRVARRAEMLGLAGAASPRAAPSAASPGRVHGNARDGRDVCRAAHGRPGVSVRGQGAVSNAPLKQDTLKQFWTEQVAYRRRPGDAQKPLTSRDLEGVWSSQAYGTLVMRCYDAQARSTKRCGREDDRMRGVYRYEDRLSPGASWAACSAAGGARPRRAGRPRLPGGRVEVHRGTGQADSQRQVGLRAQLGGAGRRGVRRSGRRTRRRARRSAGASSSSRPATTARRRARGR